MTERAKHEPGPLSPTLKRFFLFFFLCVLGALTVPGLWIANRVEPMVLGLPFLLFWVVAWVLISLVGQVTLYLVDRSNREEDP